MGRFGKKIDDDQHFRFTWFEEVLQKRRQMRLLFSSVLPVIVEGRANPFLIVDEDVFVLFFLLYRNIKLNLPLVMTSLSTLS